MKRNIMYLVLILIVFLTSCNKTESVSYDPFFWGVTEVTYEVFSEAIEFSDLLTLQDFEDGEIIIDNTMISGDIVDFDVVGEYIVIYSFTDSDGNDVTYNLSVSIVDNVIPIITFVGPDFTTIVAGEDIVIPEVVVTDNYDESFIVSVYHEVPVPTESGTYQITYNVSDSSGNDALEIIGTVYVLADVDYGYNIGDEVHMSGYYSDTSDGVASKAEIGFFKVQDIVLTQENPIGLSTLTSDEIIIWTTDEFLINRDFYVSGSVVELDVPLLHQFDYSGNLTGSSLSISGYGCAITALTMVINYMNDTSFTPEDTNYDLVNGGLVYWVNTEIEKYSNITPNYYPSYSQYRTEIPFSNEEEYLLFQMRISEKLDEGIPVLVKIRGNTTHYVVATGYGYDIYGNMYIKINDPGSSYRFYLSDLTTSYQYFYEGFIYYTD